MDGESSGNVFVREAESRALQIVADAVAAAGRQGYAPSEAFEIELMRQCREVAVVSLCIYAYRALTGPDRELVGLTCLEAGRAFLRGRPELLTLLSKQVDTMRIAPTVDRDVMRWLIDWAESEDPFLPDPPVQAAEPEAG